MAFEHAHGFALGRSFADAAVKVGARFGLVLGADTRDRVDGVVDLAVTVTAEPVADGLARRGGERRRPVPAGCVELEAG
jgi:hypothetical protein